MRYSLVASLMALGLSFAAAQNPFVRAADAAAHFQPMECSGQAELTPGTVMTYRGAMATVSRYCYAAPLHPNETQQLWTEALTMLGARAPINWETREASDSFLWHSYIGTFAGFMGEIEVMGRPYGNPVTLIVLTTGEMELDTITGRPLIIVGSTRLAVVQGLLREGWALDPNQPTSGAMLRFHGDIDLTVLFDASDVAIGVNFFNARGVHVSPPRALELIRLAGEGIALRQQWHQDQLVEIHVGEEW